MDPLTSPSSILQRLEHDHGREMTAKVCRRIAVSRFGMLATEILDLLSGREPAFPRLSWSRFYRALAPNLRPIDERTGQDLLAFCDDQLRLAVYQRYLDMHSPSDRATDALRAVHGELAHYFRNAAIEEDGEFPKWRGRKRVLGELPHHQLGAGMWDALEKTLTDIAFVEAKSRAGMVADLVRDYAAAERAWPGQEEERRSDREHQQRVQEYVGALIRYSSAHSARRDGQAVEAPPLPEPPPSVLRTTEPDPVEAEHQWAPLDRVRAWGHFVSNHTGALASGLEPAFQLAYNSVDSGPVPGTLEDRLGQGAGPPASWLSLKSRLPFLLHPACLKTFEGHTDWVRALAVTPDGQRAVSASNDKTLRVWNLETGDSRVLESHTKGVSAVAMTPDGRRAVSGGDDRTLRVWNLETGRFRRFEGHAHGVWAVAMTPDGQRAISGSDGSTLRVWDLATGQSRVLQGQHHAHGVWAVAMTPDGRRAISGGPDSDLCVWDLEGCQCLRSLAGPPDDGFRSVSVTPDGQRAVSGGRRFLLVWDLETGHSRVLEGHTGGVNALALMPDGKRAVSGSLDHTLRVWDLETGRSRVLEGHTDAIFALAVTSDGRRAVSGGRDTTLRVWDLEKGQSRVRQRHKIWVSTVAVTADGRRAISGSGDNTVRVWDLETQNSRVLEGHTDSVRGVAVTPDGRRAVSANDDKTLRVWNLETGHCQILEGHTREVDSVKVTPDGRRAVSESRDRTLRVWDLETGCSRVFAARASGISVLAVTPDGRAAVCACGDNTVRACDLETDDFRLLEGNTSGASAVAVTPDGRGAISASGDKTLRVWNLETGDSNVLAVDMGRVKTLAVTPDGRRAISFGGLDWTLRVWDLPTGNSRVLEGHTSEIFAFAVTPDGRLAVSGGWDDTLRVWDLQTGAMVAIYKSTEGAICSAAQRFPMLVAGTHAGRVEFLRLIGPRRGSPLPLPGPRVATAVRVWLATPGVTGGSWDDALTAFCDACGQNFLAPLATLEAIATIHGAAGLGPCDSPCLKLPGEAWADPRLLSECPHCHESLTFNPFVVDNRDRYPAP